MRGFWDLGFFQAHFFCCGRGGVLETMLEGVEEVGMKSMKGGR
jgi:hypothetical protein